MVVLLGGRIGTAKWAIEPRKFFWVIKDRLAAAEWRREGDAPKRRRQEEILWLRKHGFTWVVSLLDSPLHAYEEMGMSHSQLALRRVGGDLVARLPDYSTLAELLEDPSQRVLVYWEDFDRLCGVLAGYLLYAGLVEGGPVAISIIERLTGRQMGPPGREVVAVTLEEGLVGQKSRRSPASTRRGLVAHKPQPKTVVARKTAAAKTAGPTTKAAAPRAVAAKKTKATAPARATKRAAPAPAMEAAKAAPAMEAAKKVAPATKAAAVTKRAAPASAREAAPLKKASPDKKAPAPVAASPAAPGKKPAAAAKGAASAKEVRS